MPNKNRSQKEAIRYLEVVETFDPIATIRKIAKAVGVKVGFGRPMTEPNNCWCELKECQLKKTVPTGAHLLAIGWGKNRQEAAADLLKALASQYWFRTLKKAGNVYYQIVLTPHGYLLVGAGTPIQITPIR